MSRFITKGKIKKAIEYCIPTIENWIDGLLTLFSMALAILTVSSVNDKLKAFAVFDGIVFWVVVGCATFAFAKIAITFVKHFFRTRYEKTLLKECLSSNTLLHMNAANDSKVRKILRSTYGTVAEWNPINYNKNVLIYDVHDQIRSVLIGLKEVIIEITEGLSSDQVCVDLIYCYPSKEYNGHIPIHESNTQMNYKKEWTIITSGDTSQSSCKAHDYLLDRKSFYSYLDEHNYGFINNKGKSEYYIGSKKDAEYNNIGSTAGIVIELKNDCPEEVFVKALLTISTYGKTLYEENKKIRLADYKEIFKENVINTYKSLIRAELAAMFIRHSIKNDKIDRTTGKYYAEGMKKNNEET